MMSIIEQVKSAKAEEMSDLIFAVKWRYQELFPDWELDFICFEKAVDKNEQLDSAIALLEKMKEKQAD